MENTVMNARESAASIDSRSPAEALIPFLGYYTLDPVVGSFLMVDVSMQCNIPPVSGISYQAKITISLDGENSQTYLSAERAFTFSGTTLQIPDIAILEFQASTAPTSVSGTINGQEVSGTTPFGPVQPQLWSGTYYCQLPPYPVNPHLRLYSYFAALQLNADGTVLFTATPGDLQPVSSYWYDYGMFVFGLSVAGKWHLFEMGTSTGWGRVAGNAHDGNMLVSIRLQQPAPIL